MIETSSSLTSVATVLHRVTGAIDQQRAEQELMETERVRFFVDKALAEQWLEHGHGDGSAALF